MLIGYARCSTRRQDVQVQREQLIELGVEPKNILVDEGYTGSNRQRPGLEKALDRCREGDVFVVTKLDRLARSVTDAHEIAQQIDAKGAALQIGSSIHDPDDPMGKMMFTSLSMIAEFERDLMRMRTREGMVKAKSQGRLKGKKPKLTAEQDEQVITWFKEGKKSQRQMARILNVGPSTITRTKRRLQAQGLLD